MSPCLPIFLPDPRSGSHTPFLIFTYLIIHGLFHSCPTPTENTNSPSGRSPSRPACAASVVSLSCSAHPSRSPMLPLEADRRPIDPPPIIQLRVIDPHTRQPPSPANPDAEDVDPNYAHSFLQNPYYFMFASLAKPDDDTELHWLKVRLSVHLSPTLFHFIPPRRRMAKHDALLAQSFLPFTISKIPRIATKTLVFLFFQISVYAPRVATVLNSVSLKSSSTSSLLSLALPHLSSTSTATPFVTANPSTLLHFTSILQKSFLAWKVRCLERSELVLSDLSCLCPRSALSFMSAIGSLCYFVSDGTLTTCFF